MKESILKLKENIFYRAKIFIEDAGHFVPFAAKMRGVKVTDIMAYEDFEGSVEGMQFVNILKDNIVKDLEAGLIDSGAVAYDVIIDLENGDGAVEKRDALCLEITEDGLNWSDEYFPYMVINNQCIWK